MWRAGAVLVCLSLPAVAEAPDASPFPRPRPPAPTAADPAQTAPPDAPPAALDAATQAALDAVEQAATAAPAEEPASMAQPAPTAGAPSASPFPRARPDTATATAAPETETAAPAPARRGLLAGLFGAPRPRPRPDQTDIAAAAAAPRGNGICGNPVLTGETLEPIGSHTHGCGVAAPVKITAVDGIQLSIPATVDCPTANALAAWVDQGLRPAFADRQVTGLQIAGSYICRTRNHIRGAPISEHGRGKAVDIAAIVFADGTVLSVAQNWNTQMRAAYRAGCGIFGTTLGPGSDGYHEDHMHFDTASYRSGPYCR